MSSGIAPLEADFKGPITTAEGDYVILQLQLARFLQKSLAAARAGETLPGLTACLSPLSDPSYNPVKDGKPAEATTAAAFFDIDFLERLFQYRVLVGVCKCGDALKARTDAGMSFDAAMNATARMLYV